MIKTIPNQRFNCAKCGEIFPKNLAIQTTIDGADDLICPECDEKVQAVPINPPKKETLLRKKQK